ncbi:MAG TPA: SH3 domain-containing protein [Gemmatimonadaceae bacterium]|jgi:hypothetical protein|nr:SH3 domain-containing protein [Gemmatimonadaceae bacterium]
MLKRFLFLLTMAPTLLGAQTRYASTALEMHAGASTRSRVLANLVVGSAVQVRDCDHAGGEWCLVVFGAQRGFVEARYLDSDDPSSVKGDVLPLAGGSRAARRSGEGAAMGLSAVAPAAPQPHAPSRVFFRGPRGGCYTLSAGGNKRYVDRSLCN